MKGFITIVESGEGENGGKNGTSKKKPVYFSPEDRWGRGIRRNHKGR